MALGIVQATQASNRGTGVSTLATAAFSSNTTSGNGIVVAVAYTNGGYGTGVLDSVSDNKGNTYALIGSLYSFGDNSMQLAYCGAITTGGSGHTVSCNFVGGDGNAGYIRIIAHEVSGGALTLGQFSTGNTDSSSPFQATAIVPANDGEYILGAAYSDSFGGALAAESPFAEPTNGTADAGVYEVATIYYVQPTAASIQAGWTGGGPAFMRVASFYVAGPPPLIIRPSADDTDGGWTDSAAGTNLFAQLDETSASDADYIRSADNPSSDTCKIHLGDPGVNVTTPVNLRVRYAKVGTGTINLTVKLFEGTTELWANTYNNISASFTTTTASNITLNQPISDETNLYAQFIATAA